MSPGYLCLHILQSVLPCGLPHMGSRSESPLYNIQGFLLTIQQATLLWKSPSNLPMWGVATLISDSNRRTTWINALNKSPNVCAFSPSRPRIPDIYTNYSLNSLYWQLLPGSRCPCSSHSDSYPLPWRTGVCLNCGRSGTPTVLACHIGGSAGGGRCPPPQLPWCPARGGT